MQRAYCKSLETLESEVLSISKRIVVYLIQFNFTTIMVKKSSTCCIYLQVVMYRRERFSERSGSQDRIDRPGWL